VKRTDADHLDDALTHLRVLHEHLMLTEAHDQVVLDAAALRLSASMECVGQVSDKLRTTVIDERTSRAVRGMRHRIAHAYAFVDPAVLRSTLKGDVAGFHDDVRRLRAKV
jgi:uncharacterized protein with HEPN domain